MAKRYIRKHLKLILLIVLVAFFIGVISGSQIDFDELGKMAFVAPLEGEQIRTMLVPAVDQDGKGVPSTLTVTTSPGHGRVLVNINDVLAGVDTQESAKIAAQEAAEYVGISLQTLDIIYRIDAEAPIVSGASAGASMAVSTIAALQGKQLNPKVSMTGAINEDGEVIDVGSIQAKAEAMRDEGITLFIVPEGQGHEEEYERTSSCEVVESVEVCRSKYGPTGTSIGDALGIEVIEVENLNDTIKHFIV